MDIPPVVVFDLDGTLWNPEMYELFGGGGAPFTKLSRSELADRRDTRVKLLGDVPAVLDLLDECHSTTVAIASRTDEPAWAEECMEKLTMKSGRSLSSLFRIKEIYKGCKKGHLQEISRKSGIPLSEMLFFDNERGNVNDAISLGVPSVYCPHGVTKAVWENGLSNWRKATRKQ
ncbi:Magnesium-dependent phosphatase 1 [Perkinsela sp. CCAP 1560/4]|nr:Magnesium-dependent phosphatase 1 [Perkinsela sp. CCAP 1560/4]|eukprot:KNH05884.1 Magnesium-dependent phosphatase 1 [Perkinsela sp. CCAP 1560/4]